MSTTKNTTRKPARKPARKRAKKSSARSDVDALLSAAESKIADMPDADDTTPPSEDELQAMLDTTVLGSYVEGQPSVCETILRPITAACVTMLKQIESGLVSGLKVTEIDNMALHSAQFVVIWRDTGEDEDSQVREARRLIRVEHRDELEELAYKWLDTISPHQIGEITNQSIFALRDAMSTQVQPLPRDGENDDNANDGGEEVEGND